MKNKPNFFSHLKNDLPASLVVFLVAVPLCLGIALASDAPPFAGIIAGIVGGIVVGLLSGSALGVSGPAAGLAVIVATALSDIGKMEGVSGAKEIFGIFLFVVVVSGVFQIILGLLKLGVIGYYFPNSVIKGMLSGIGIIIFLKQIPHAFGYDRDTEGDQAFWQRDDKNTFSEITDMFQNFELTSTSALILSIVSIIILVIWEKPFIKSYSWSKIIQGPLVVVVLGIISYLLLEGDENLQLVGDRVVEVPVSKSISDFFGQFSFPDFSKWKHYELYVIAGTIAIVASLESLLSTEATDKLDPQKRVTPPNRELFAQGAGNIVSGLIGGLPITQVIVRSSANIQSGGKTKAAAVLHGVILLVFVWAAPQVLNMIPKASLAAILIVVGYKLAKPAVFKNMAAGGMSEFLPFIATIIAMIFSNLLVGIGVGMAVANVHIFWVNYKMPYHLEEEDHDEEHVLRLRLSEYVNFLNKARILKLLNELPEGTHLIIDGSKSTFIHPDVIDIIMDFLPNQKRRNVIVDYIAPGQSMKVDPVKVVKQKVERLP